MIAKAIAVKKKRTGSKYSAFQKTYLPSFPTEKVACSITPP